MATDGKELKTEKTDPFTVKVLGGKFHVHEIALQSARSTAEIRNEIQEVTEDRWFVMVSDHPGEKHDSLAVIDDGLEFQVFALGSLEQD